MRESKKNDKVKETDILGISVNQFNNRLNHNISYLFIRFVCDHIGVSDLSDDSVKYISKILTLKLSELILESKKYVNMSNRSKLTCHDINMALVNKGLKKYIIMDSIYDHNNLVKMHISHRGIYDMYFYNDVEIDVDDYLNELKNKLKMPYSDIGLRAHWLILNGVQPCIAENPYTSPDCDTIECENGENGLPTSFHLQLFYKELTEASIGTLEDKRKDALTLLQRDPSVRYLIVPLCSFIYQGIRVNIASKNLALLIYIMRMVCSIVQNPALSIHVLEPHLNELIPSILSCILSPVLCSKQFEENHWALRIYSSKLICNLCSNFDSIISNLRYNIIEVLKNAIQSTINSISFNMDEYQVLLNNSNIEPENFPYTTHFGAFYTFSLFSMETCREHFLPFAHSLGEMYSNINLICTKNELNLLKKDISKTETVILQIFTSISRKDTSCNYIKEQLFGKYFTQLILHSS